MEFSTRYPLLDRFGKPLPEHIQRVLDLLTPKFRRKFPMIRDEVALTEILEEAGQRIARREAENGAISRIHGYAWVAIRNVAISKLRTRPHLLEKAMAGSRESAAALARLAADEGSPESIEAEILLEEVLEQVSHRDRKIAIWKKAGFSSRWIAEKLQMSAPAVDTAYSRLRRKVENLLETSDRR